MVITREELEKRRAEGILQLTELEGKEFLRSVGITVPKSALTSDVNEAALSAAEIGYPVVIKGQLREVTHKSDLGLVKVNIKNEGELRKAYAEVEVICAGIGGEYRVLVEKMCKFDTELIAAVNDDPTFGKVIMFGLGGIFVEVIKDVSFGICPITRKDAYDMIESLRSSKLFDGVRGRKPINKEKLADFLLSLGGCDGIGCKYGDAISTIEINPVVVTEEGELTALDSVVTLKPAGAEKKAPFVPVNMDRMFTPKAIGIVGVSDKPSMALTFMKKTVEAGYKGEIYPINPTHVGEMVLGYETYGSLKDVPGDIDYVYVAVPAKAVPSVIADAGEKNIPFVHIISGGFAEVGGEGKELEEKAKQIAAEHGVRLIGPNCMGMVSTRPGIIFTTGVDPTVGGVSLISQSGGITTEMLRAGSAQGVRFNKVISIGNCADLGIEEFLEYMGNDPETKVIGIYSETIRDGSLLTKLLREICPKKPVVIIKGGRSTAGAKAAASHTGALSSSYALWEAMCRETGATLVRTLEEFLNALLSFEMIKPSAENSVLLVSHSGGVVVTSTDLSEDYDLTLPKLDSELQDKLKALGLPPGANVSNPMDISLGVMASKTKEGDSINVIGDIFRLVGDSCHFGYYVFYLMADNVIESGGGKQLIKNIIDFAIEWGGKGGEHEGEFVLAANSHTHPDYIAAECKRANDAGVMVFPNINEMLQNLGTLSKYGKFLKDTESGK